MKRTTLMIIVTATLLLGVFAGCTDSGTQKPADTSYAQPAVAALTAQKIVYAEGAPSEDEEVPNPGICLLGYQLKDALEDTENDGALFFVRLRVYYDIGRDFTYNGKTLDTWRDVPELNAYDNDYDKWYDDIYLPLDAEMREAETNGEKYAQGWEKHDPWALYDEYWRAAQTPGSLAAYDAARDKALEAQHAYMEWQNSYASYAEMDKKLESEYEHLVSLGFDVERYERDLIGRLTKEQVLNFPCGDCGYHMLLATKKEDGIDVEPCDE